MEVIVEERPQSAREVLERDEALLAEGRPTVRVGLFGETAVSLGIAQRDESALEGRARSLGYPIVRRRSGGSALLHRPGDIFWSLVLDRDHPLVGRGFVHRYSELGEGWRRFLGRKGLDAAWDCPPALNETYCLLSQRGQVLTARGGVLGGASQHVTSRTLLHHGVVACSLDAQRLVELFGLGEERKRLTSLSDLGATPSNDELRTLALDLKEGLATHKAPTSLVRSPSDDKRVS